MAAQPTAQAGATYQPAPFNVNQAAAGALQGAIGGTQAAMQSPLNVGSYMNPYTSEVIDRTQQDIERQRQMAMNTLGAQATQARAFGGSRQGVAEGVLAGEYGRMAGDIAAQQRQAGYGQALQSAMADRAARAGYASQLGQLGGQAFGVSRDITQQQMQQGLMQQAMQQQLIDAARQQYAGYTGAPQAALAAPLAALGATPNQSTQTTSKKAGLFDYLTLAAQTVALSDIRLKKNVTPSSEIGGIKFYTWDWNEAGKKLADPAQPTFGVIADELQQTHPHLVSRGGDGYLRVNYAGLAHELESAA
jgi:hypothetical protein